MPCVHIQIILYMRPANERRRCIVTSSLIGWAHIQNAEIIMCMHPANEIRSYIVTLSLIGWAHAQNAEIIMCMHPANERGRYIVTSSLIGCENTQNDHFVYAPSQWERTLLCNVVSHWLGAYTKWSLHIFEVHTNKAEYWWYNWITDTYTAQPMLLTHWPLGDLDAILKTEFSILLSGVPDYFGHNKISSAGDLSHYSSASLY